MGQIALFRWKRELTAQLNGCRNSPRQQKQQWGTQVVAAALQANAAEVDVVASIIAMGADSSRTTERGTTTTTTGMGDLLHLDVTTVLAALEATMAEAAVTESTLVSFVTLPGTKSSSALRRDKHQCLSLRDGDSLF